MSKKMILGMVEVVIIIISLYAFFTPSVLIPSGYILSLDGVVIARTMCLIFALYNIVKLSKIFLLEEVSRDK